MYKLGQIDLTTNEPMCIIKFNADGSVTSFGKDESNTDYQAFLRWREEGNTPLPAEEQA